MKKALTFNDVLITPKYSGIKSRSLVNTKQSIELFRAFSRSPFHIELDIPILSANMDTITEVKMADKMSNLGGIGVFHRSFDLSKFSLYRQLGYSNKLYSAIAVGSIHNSVEKIKIDNILAMDEIHHLKDSLVVCVDLAHGHSIHMKDTLEYIRSKDPGVRIIAGNVATKEAAQDLFDWGADIIKVGIGPGSACTTRIKTGCGVPQLTAIMDCSKAGIPIIADGGIRSPGDAAKALAAGADLIMVGGMLAGTDCTPNWEENKEVLFRGMASKGAKIDYGIKDSNQEGIEAYVKAKPSGSTQKVISELVEGIKSAMSYVGAENLVEFRAKAEFLEVSGNTGEENIPHILR